MAPSMPLRTRSSSAVRAVNMMTGSSSASRSVSLFMRVSTVQPSIAGIITSSSTRSVLSWRTTSSACSPVRAVRTRCPSSPRFTRMTSRMSCSSSMARTVAIREPRLETRRRAHAHACQPGRRVTDLGQRGQPLGAPPDRGQGLGPGRLLDGADEPGALLVLEELGLDAHEPLEDPRHPRCLPPLAEHAVETLGARHLARAGPVHREVDVAFEHAHHPLVLD